MVVIFRSEKYVHTVKTGERSYKCVFGVSRECRPGPVQKPQTSLERRTKAHLRYARTHTKCIPALLNTRKLTFSRAVYNTTSQPSIRRKLYDKGWDCARIAGVVWKSVAGARRPKSIMYVARARIRRRDLCAHSYV